VASSYQISDRYYATGLTSMCLLTAWELWSGDWEGFPAIDKLSVPSSERCAALVAYIDGRKTILDIEGEGANWGYTSDGLRTQQERAVVELYYSQVADLITALKAESVDPLEVALYGLPMPPDTTLMDATHYNGWVAADQAMQAWIDDDCAGLAVAVQDFGCFAAYPWSYSWTVSQWAKAATLGAGRCARLGWDCYIVTQHRDGWAGDPLPIADWELYLAHLNAISDGVVLADGTTVTGRLEGDWLDAVTEGVGATALTCGWASALRAGALSISSARTPFDIIRVRAGSESITRPSLSGEALTRPTLSGEALTRPQLTGESLTLAD